MQRPEHGLDAVLRPDRRRRRLHDLGDGQRHRRRILRGEHGGSAAITSEAITPSGPCGAARDCPARRCAKTAAQAAWAGDMPLASIAPVTPESTSPVPAVASAGAPPGEIATRPDGAATSVSSPLSTTIAFAREAAARA